MKQNLFIEIMIIIALKNEAKYSESDGIAI